MSRCDSSKLLETILKLFVIQANAIPLVGLPVLCIPIVNAFGVSREVFGRR